jgi:hypothetical protein
MVIEYECLNAMKKSGQKVLLFSFYQKNLYNDSHRSKLFHSRKLCYSVMMRVRSKQLASSDSKGYRGVRGVRSFSSSSSKRMYDGNTNNTHK